MIIFTLTSPHNQYFNKHSLSKKIATMVDDINALQRLELKEAFDEFDKDGSGTITTKELLPVLRSIGQNPTEDEILGLVIEYDVNGDGTIDFDEFIEMMTKHTQETVDQTAEMREAFKIFDRDGNGYIDLRELKTVITRMGEPLSDREAEEIFRVADLNGDGKLDYDEFVSMILQTDDT